MKHEIRTDLAIERRSGKKIPRGTRFHEEKTGGFTLSELDILSSEAAGALGRPIGRYETVAFPPPSLLLPEERASLVSLLSERLTLFYRRLCPDIPIEGSEILLVALGNARLVSDSLGPSTAAGLSATAHLREIDSAWFESLRAASLRILAPGVLADSGIEAAELAAALCGRYPSSLVIALDALAARESRRLLRTVQISDTGITPGSGTDGGRRRLDRETLGAPVLAVGVPTVIDYREESGASLFVTPKEIDCEIRILSDLLARAISRTLGIPDLL